MARTTYNRRKNGSGSVISSKTSLAHTGTVVNNQCSYFVVAHCYELVVLVCKKKTNTFIATIKDEKTNWSWERDALVTDRSFIHPNTRKFNFYASTERQAMFVTFQFRFNLTLKRKALFALCACMLYVITLKPVTARGGSKFRKTQVVKLKVFTLPTVF